MLLLQFEACSFQLGTNLSGKLLRRLFLSSVKSLASFAGLSGGDVFQLFMACWRLSRVRGEGVDNMSSKLIRCPPQSNELRPGLLGESVVGFFWLNAAARSEVAAPVMLWAAPEEVGKLYLDDGGELDDGDTVLIKLTPEPSSVGMTEVVAPTSTLIMSESIRFDPGPDLGIVTEGVCCGGRVAPLPGMGGRFFSFE